MECSCGGFIGPKDDRLICSNCGCDYGQADAAFSHSAPVTPPPPKPPAASPPVVPSAIAVADKYDFTVLPFVANIDIQQGASEAASQLQSVITQYSAQGWEYVRLETVETYVRGDSGCLGIGSTDPRWEHFKMIVLRRKR